MKKEIQTRNFQAERQCRINFMLNLEKKKKKNRTEFVVTASS